MFPGRRGGCVCVQLAEDAPWGGAAIPRTRRGLFRSLDEAGPQRRHFKGLQRRCGRGSLQGEAAALQHSDRLEGPGASAGTTGRPLPIDPGMRHPTEEIPIGNGLVER